MAQNYPENHEDIPADFNAVTFGLHNALSKADSNKNLVKMYRWWI